MKKYLCKIDNSSNNFAGITHQFVLSRYQFVWQWVLVLKAERKTRRRCFYSGSRRKNRKRRKANTFSPTNRSLTPIEAGKAERFMRSWNSFSSCSTKALKSKFAARTGPPCKTQTIRDLPSSLGDKRMCILEVQFRISAAPNLFINQLSLCSLVRHRKQQIMDCSLEHYPTTSNDGQPSAFSPNQSNGLQT